MYKPVQALLNAVITEFLIACEFLCERFIMNNFREINQKENLERTETLKATTDWKISRVFAKFTAFKLIMI